MTIDAEWIKIDPERILCVLRQEAVEKINSGPGEVILDFSSVLRVDSNVVGAMEELAGLAEERSVKVALRGVNLDVYKVLKLLRLTERFSFLT
jgi:anti-anti-sigma regulatory factor